jgi:hypothetical protein
MTGIRVCGEDFYTLWVNAHDECRRDAGYFCEQIDDGLPTIQHFTGNADVGTIDL